MAKKLFGAVAAIAALLTVVLAMSAFATPNTIPEAQAASEPSAASTAAIPVAASNVSSETSNADCDFYTLMLDENGALVNEDVLEANLDQAIADGAISTEDKEYILEMYGLMSDGSFDDCPMMSGETSDMGDFDDCPMMSGATFGGSFGGCPMMR